jgi:hypothetical protein
MNKALELNCISAPRSLLFCGKRRFYFLAFRLAAQYFRILTLTALRCAADIRRPRRPPRFRPGPGLEIPAMAAIAARTLKSCVRSCRSARAKSLMTV